MLLVLAIMTSAVLADTIAYVNPSGTQSNQGAGLGPIGMDFDVNQDIVITQLGVFDAGENGVALPLQARLYERKATVTNCNSACNVNLVAKLDFTPDDPGTLIDASVFKPLDDPITLPAGFKGTIVASGFGASQGIANGFGNQTVSWTTDDGGGLISFVGSGRFGDAALGLDQFPYVVDGGPVNRYAAGTFMFKPAQ
jgi:hypothetical protein